MTLVILVLVVAAVLVLGWAFLPQRKLPVNRVRRQRVRLWLRLHPGKGHATLLQLFWRWGRWASFRQSARVRPTLPWRDRLDPYEHSIYLGRAQYGRKVRVGLQENLVILAPPRVGKSGFLAQAVLHSPGGVVSSSTRADIFNLTSGVRSRHGKIHVLNPQGIGNVESTFRWSPLEGCEDPATAIRRADSLIYAVGADGDDQAWWCAKASDGMRAILHAGALMDVGFDVVAAMIMSGNFSSAIDALTRAGRPQFAASLRELMGPAERTTATVRMFMSRAVAFMTDPVLAQAVMPKPGQSLDIDQFVSGKNSLYLIGEAQGAEAPLASLYVALCTEIQFRAVQLGSRMPGSRLSNPLYFALDEATQTTPLPGLPQWMADGSGKGLPVTVVAHGVAQLKGRYGDAGSRAILDTAGCWLLLGGINDPATLEMAEKLSGEVAIAEHGRDDRARHPILSAEMIRELPPGFGLLLRGALAPVIVRLPMCWKDRTYRRAKRRGQAVANLVRASAGPAPVAAAAELPDDLEMLLPPDPFAGEEL